MIARIKLSEGNSYDSIVLLAEFCGENSKVIVFNENYSNLILKNIYDIGKDRSISQRLVIINWDTEGMTITEEQYYYNFIKEYENQLNQLPEEIFAKCRQMQNEMFVSEWQEIINEKSINDLLSTAGYFHDGEIDNVEKTEKYTILSMAIWGGQIHMKLKNPEFSEKFIEELSNCGYIYDSNIFFENGRIYFVDGYHIKCCSDIKEGYNWVACDKMEWKITLDDGVV